MNFVSNESFRFGISAPRAKILTEPEFKKFAQVGVKELELSFSTEQYDFLDWRGIEKMAKAHNIHLWSFHLPFLPFEKINIASKDAEVRSFSVNYLSEFIRKASNIGVKIVVIHPSGEPNEEKERAELLKSAQDSLAKLANVAGTCGATIAVENLPRTCLGKNSAEIRTLLEADDRLGVCFDTNHLLQQPIKEFIEDVGNQIITTHFSDCDFINERHWMPGFGKINWKELLETLKAVGYEGPILYEVAFVPPAGVDRKEYTCEDFKKNYKILKSLL